MVAAQIGVVMVCLACLSTNSFGSFTSLEPDKYVAGTKIPDSGAYMRYWSASITGLLTSDGHVTDIYAAEYLFMPHYTYSVNPSTYVNPSTFERVYGYTASPGSSIYDGAAMHILFGTYNASEHQFNFQPTNFVSIDVLWPTLSSAATYVTLQAFSANNTLLGSYRYNNSGSGSFTRMALSFSGIARVAIVPPSTSYDQYGLDWLNFIDTNTGTSFDLTTYDTIKAPDAMTLANSDSLTGTGTIAGDLINNGGTISPGHSAGTITIEGQFTQSPDGLTVMELGAESDQIIVSQDANLAGRLEIVLSEDFDFLDGDIFTLMTYLSHSGEFDNVLGLVFDGGFFDLTYGDSALTLTANSTASTVPIPGAALLLGSGLLQLAIYSRRRKSAASS
jgi:hypothetical protein